MVNVTRSERIPGRARCELQVADICTETQADARADGHHDDVAGGEGGHSKAANKICRAVDAAEALINGVGGREIVDEHHCACALAAGVKADRRAFPEHAAVAGILRVKFPVAVAQANHESAAAFLTKHISVRLAPPADGGLYDLGQATGHRAKETMAFTDQFTRREGARLRRWWRRVLG